LKYSGKSGSATIVQTCCVAAIKRLIRLTGISCPSITVPKRIAIAGRSNVSVKRIVHCALDAQKFSSGHAVFGVVAKLCHGHVFCFPSDPRKAKRRSVLQVVVEPEAGLRCLYRILQLTDARSAQFRGSDDDGHWAPRLSNFEFSLAPRRLRAVNLRTLRFIHLSALSPCPVMRLRARALEPNAWRRAPAERAATEASRCGTGDTARNRR
jgi:hypothetical protein